MYKSVVEKTLKFLQSIFGDDADANRAILLLVEKIKGHDFAPAKEVPAVVEGFPLTEEIKAACGKNPHVYALFCDGACRNNPGPGSWAAIAQDCSEEILFESTGVDFHTTNNKMELEGAIQALQGLLNYFAEINLEDEPKVFLFSDSKYVIDGITSWVPGWKNRGWRKADNKEPENLEFWKRFDKVTLQFKQVEFRWVKGHSGFPQNEHCDKLANQALNESGF